jgi:hypothetical protein
MKGQTVVECLMTYGWAILIILIVAGVLAYYGIFQLIQCNNCWNTTDKCYMHQCICNDTTTSIQNNHLTILSLFMPSSNTCDIESFENNLVNVTFKGRKSKAT